MDQACFNATNSQGLIERVCMPNLYFFSVTGTNKSNDLAEMDFQGYIGLVPEIHSENGTFDAGRPALVTQLQQNGLINDPVVGINLK